MENIKEIFASFGLWSLVEDVSDDGDGIGDDLQLTKEGEEARRMIEQQLDKAREEVLTELQEEFSEFGVPDDVRYTKPLFYINEIIEEKLSKLKQ